jgi:hypothetical protein
MISGPLVNEAELCKMGNSLHKKLLLKSEGLTPEQFFPFQNIYFQKF